MRGGFITRHARGGLTLSLLWACLAASLAAQATKPQRADIPRMPDGKPDLQGRWFYGNMTPKERPPGMPLELTEKDVAQLEQKQRDLGNLDLQQGGVGAYNQFWRAQGMNLVRINGRPRSSLIVDPPDGRFPPFTPEGKSKVDAVRKMSGKADRAQDRPEMERCLLGFNSGPPLVPGSYNNNVEIVQNAEHVAMAVEQVHNVRMFALDGKPHTGIRRWLGDSTARWEGDTLVVDTINFLNTSGVTDPSMAGRGNGPRAHLIERFSLLDRDTMLYAFTMEDPDLWTRPWTMETTLVRTPDPLLEYACHEGNYAVPNALSGARAVEKKAQGK